MAVNRTKVLEAAQKFLSKGQYDKAIAEYQKLVAEDPRDVRTLLKIGDLHTKRSKPKDAIEVYLKVAELYAKQGFFLKAVAVYKQILKLDAAHLESSQKLAKMYEELALTSDALNTYEQVADAYLTQGQTQKALETMERMVELDGQNVAVRIKHAEALSKADKTKEAAKAFAEGAALLKEQGRMDDYIRVVERQLYHDPENLELARGLSSLYLERQDPKRALAKLQICFKADPRDVQTLEMLAEAFRQLGQIPKTISVLKEISRLQAEFGATEARRRTLQRVLDLDPNDAEARQGMGGAPGQAQRAEPAASMPRPPPQPQDRMPTATQIERMGTAGEPQRTIRGLAPSAAAAVSSAAALAAERAAQAEAVRAVQTAGRGGRASSSFPPGPSASAEAEPAVGESDDYDLLDASDDSELALDDREADQVLIIDESSEHQPVAEAAVQKPAPVRQPEGPQERIARLLSDADAHEGYGLHEKVESLLKEVLTIDAEHLPTHERLKDLYVATDRRVDAARELLWLSNAWADRNRGRAIQYARDAQALAPHAAPVKARLAALGVDPGRAPPSSEEVRLGGHPAPAAGRPVARSVLAARERAPAPPASLREAASNAQRDADVLELPITRDEFDAPPPTPKHALYTEQYAELLEREVAPDEFDREPLQLAPEPAAIEELRRPSMADLLDAPISPDEFDAPPPRRSSVGPTDLRELLERPHDDFGLSDERFDRSGLIEAHSTEIGDAVEIRAAVAQSLVPDDIAPTVPPAVTYRPDANEPSVEFVEVGTGQLDVHSTETREEPPVLLQSAVSEVFAELDSSDLEFDRDDLIPASARATMRPRGRPALPGLPPLVSAAPVFKYDEPAPAPPALAEPEALPQPPSVPPPPSTSAKVAYSEAFGAVARQPPSFEPPSQTELLSGSVESTETGPLILPVDELTAPGVAIKEFASEMTPEIEETTDEADFFASQGMMDDAVDLIQEAMLIYPGNRILRAKMKQYETEAGAQEFQKTPDADAKKHDDKSFGIAKQLADGPQGAGPGAANDEMVDVESVFAQFKKGVAEQIDIDDSETHFDLAIAYREMGLINDAMQEFEIAARGPRRACAALTMIGTCALEQGDLKRAVEQFHRALATEPKGHGEEFALQYELGNAYELLGEFDRALKAFEQAAMRDRNFRDVSQRVDRLRRMRGGANVDDAEVDAALDDLLSSE